MIYFWTCVKVRTFWTHGWVLKFIRTPPKCHYDSLDLGCSQWHQEKFTCWEHKNGFHNYRQFLQANITQTLESYSWKKFLKQDNSPKQTSYFKSSSRGRNERFCHCRHSSSAQFLWKSFDSRAYKNPTESIFGGFKSTPDLFPHTLCPLSCVLSYQIKPWMPKVNLKLNFLSWTSS